RILQEIRETGELAQLLARASAGSTLTAQEKAKVREQLVDVAKTIPALAIFAAPGGFLLLPLLVKLLPFNLLPSSFADPPRRAGGRAAVADVLLVSRATARPAARGACRSRQRRSARQPGARARRRCQAFAHRPGGRHRLVSDRPARGNADARRRRGRRRRSARRAGRVTRASKESEGPAWVARPGLGIQSEGRLREFADVLVLQPLRALHH